MPATSCRWRRRRSRRVHARRRGSCWIPSGKSVVGRPQLPSTVWRAHGEPRLASPGRAAGPRPGLAVCGAPQPHRCRGPERHRQIDPAAHPGRPRSPRRGAGRARPRGADGGLSAAGARRPPGRVVGLLPRPADGRGRGRRRPRPADGGDEPRPFARRRVHRGARALPRPGWRRPRGAGRRGVCRRGPRRRPPGRRDGCVVGRSGRPRRAGRHPASTGSSAL